MQNLCKIINVPSQHPELTAETKKKKTVRIYKRDKRFNMHSLYPIKGFVQWYISISPWRTLPCNNIKSTKLHVSLEPGYFRIPLFLYIFGRNIFLNLLKRRKKSCPRLNAYSLNKSLLRCLCPKRKLITKITIYVSRVMTKNVHMYITCMHLADAFVQSNFQCIQAIHFISLL